MLSFSELDFILISAVCYMCGLGSGLCICAKYKNIFMERVRSRDRMSDFNHHYNTGPIVPAMPTSASAPTADKF
jgi:hypothetical protein